MRRRTPGVVRSIALAGCVLLVVGLTFTGAAAQEDLGCSYFAPVTVGTNGQLDRPPAPVASNTGETLSAGCGDAFYCPTGCEVSLIFLFTGTGIVSGEVEITGGIIGPPSFTFLAARATCGPSVSQPRSFCQGTLTASLPPADGYLLVCKADGVVAVLVNGTCTGEFR
jgi:hypothetical protein